MFKTILHQSSPLFYKVEGAGLPVVLIHGFAEDGALWDRQVNELKEHYQLIIPDLPGSGQSAARPGTTTLEDLSDSIKTILDAEGIEQGVLIGHSMGGYITLAFAEKYPHRLKAFGLFHSTAYADSHEKITGRQKSVEFILKNGAPAYIRQSMPPLFAEGTRKQHPELITRLIDRYADFNPNALAGYQQAMISRPDRTHVLLQFPKPILFIIGEQDSLLPLDASLRQTHMPRITHIHLLENSGHMGMLENSSRSSHILDDFLRSLSIQ